MKKLIKNPLFTFILGAIICGTTGVIASNLMASNIAYTPKDKTWGVNNVEAAIDSLKISKTSDNYSTDEKVVGTWIDGKPLYQKTISYTTSSNNSGKVIDSTTSFDNLISVEGYVVRNDSFPDRHMIGSYYGSGNVNGAVSIYLNTDINLVSFTSSAYLSNATAVASIKYTKTTD